MGGGPNRVSGSTAVATWIPTSAHLSAPRWKTLTISSSAVRLAPRPARYGIVPARRARPARRRGNDHKHNPDERLLVAHWRAAYLSGALGKQEPCMALNWIVVDTEVYCASINRDGCETSSPVLAPI